MEGCLGHGSTRLSFATDGERSSLAGAALGVRAGPNRKPPVAVGHFTLAMSHARRCRRRGKGYQGPMRGGRARRIGALGEGPRKRTSKARRGAAAGLLSGPQEALKRTVTRSHASSKKK